MEIGNWVTEDEVLEMLNVLPPSPSSYVRFLEKYWAGSRNVPLDAEGPAILREWEDERNQRIRNPNEGFVLNYLAYAPTLVLPAVMPEQGWQLPPTISREESQPFRDGLTSAHLRKYVDEWLDTGVQVDGSEWVGQRDVGKAFYASLALWEYLRDAPPTLSPSMDSNVVRLTIAQPSDFKGVARDFFESQIVHAKRLFAGIMLSNWNNHLCKCRYSRCARYFSHPKLRKSYKRGTFCCREHSSHAAARACMIRSRTHGPENLIEAAARKLRTWKILGPEWLDDVDLKRRLANELCVLISRQGLHGYREQVKMNWVTRHQAAIERKRVELSQSAGPSSVEPVTLR